MTRAIDTTTAPPKFSVFMHESQGRQEDVACVRILEGKFQDIVFNYGIVSVDPKTEDDPGGLMINYTYNVVEGVIGESDEIEFEDVTASILTKLVTDFVDESDE